MTRAWLLIGAIVWSGCDGGAASGGDAGTEEDAAPGDSCGAVTRTCAEVTAAFAAAGTEVSVTCSDAAGTFTLSASGIPDYMSNQSTPNAIDAQDWVLTLPLTPTCAATPTGVFDSRGPIGLMVNGVAFFGPQNALGEDAPVAEAATLDDCDGHADMQCAYHYHSEATCVFGMDDTLAAHAEADGHPALVGFAADGFPLYAPNDPATGLDDCNGHWDERRGYHYHITTAFPYFLGCFAGEPTTIEANDAGCG